MPFFQPAQPLEMPPTDPSPPDGPPPFVSILFDGPSPDLEIEGCTVPEFFTDLNLDQIVDSATAGRDQYALKPFFYLPVEKLETIRYRQEILRDLESLDLNAAVSGFAKRMQTVRERLEQSARLYYEFQKLFLFVDAASAYCAALTQLAGELKVIRLSSRGFQSLRDYLNRLIGSDSFNRLVCNDRTLKNDIDSVRYSLLINGNRITVSRYGSERDYCHEVLQAFDRFHQGATRDYNFPVSFELEMNHVEAALLDRVARLFPDVFSELRAFVGSHADFIDRTIARFDQEVQFYLAWLDLVRRIKDSGLNFCYPTVSRSKEIAAHDVFDLSLANRLLAEKLPVVTNDFYLAGTERIFIVSGPNQGGKTTFARTFGQLHYLARLGLTVPGTYASLFLFDRIFTHFEREERIEDLHSKLEDELIRIRGILDQATTNSILVMNESFLSTTMRDALFLGRQVLERIARQDMLCVSVTFLEELASLSEKTVSMVSTVDPHDPAVRTFKIVRKSADGLAYAMAIAEKHRLTYKGVRARLSGKAQEEVVQ